MVRHRSLSKLGEGEVVSASDNNAAMHAVNLDSDTRATAISLMSEALNIIDGDPTISGIVGAQLQMAIDSLLKGMSTHSRGLH